MTATYDTANGVRVYHLTERLPDDEAAALAGLYVTSAHYTLLVNHDADVYKPNGELLIRFRKKVLRNGVCSKAFGVLRNIHSTPTNRGLAAGKKEQPESGESAAQPGALESWVNGRRYIDGKPIKKDGTLSNSTRMYDSGVADQSSAIIGSFDRYARFPFCRLTAFTKDKPGEMLKCVPYIQAIDKVFCAHLPDRYAAQMEMIEQTKTDWIVPDTAFTTVTVNMNFRTAVHKDAGDLKQGFGVLSVLEAGDYTGCYLVFPQYRVAVDMRTADVLLCDVHEWHGNTPLVGKKGKYVRVSVVLYYREKMHKCGTADEELARVQARKRGDPLWDAAAAAQSRPQVTTTDGTEEDTDQFYDDEEVAEQLALANAGALGGGGELQ